MDEENGDAGRTVAICKHQLIPDTKEQLVYQSLIHKEKIIKLK